jgi:hypothetical protein
MWQGESAAKLGCVPPSGSGASPGGRRTDPGAVGPSLQPRLPAAPPLGAAAHTVSGAGRRAAVLSAELVDRHQQFVGQAARSLTGGAHTDTALYQQLGAAATLIDDGRRRLDAIVAATRTLARSAATAQTPGAQRAVLQPLHTQLSQANSVVYSTQQQASGIAGRIRALDYPSRGGVGGAEFGVDVPADRPPDPPHGQDPRYWIDVTRIIHVPEGQMAPYGTKQIGPGLWYPFDDGRLMSGPPAAKYPLDISTISTLNPGEVGPYGTSELAPGVFVADPRQSYGGDPRWPAPRLPIDVRDVIHMPKGEFAPPNYVEYLPGWWAPQPPSGPR